MSTRFLTDHEIQEIVKHIPFPVCADGRKDGLSKTILLQQMDALSSVLKTITLVDEAIPLIGPEIARYFYKAVIDPGTGVGTLASQAVSEPATQGMLKNFTSTGTLRSRSYNADRIGELLAVVSTQRYRNMTLVFEDQYMTYERILNEFRSKIVGINLSDIITEYEVISVQDIDFSTKPNSWWQIFAYIYGVDLSVLSSTFLRLHVDPNKMGMYSITMPMISSAIRSVNNGNFISVIFSPMETGIVDIFVLPGAEIKIKANHIIKIGPNDTGVFIDNVLIPAVTGTSKDGQEMQISGVKGIVDMSPVEISIASLINKVLDRSNGIYDIYINVRQEALIGISRDRIKEALKSVGCRIVKVPDIEFHYNSPNIQPLFIRVHSNGDPSELITDKYTSLTRTIEGDIKVRDYDNPEYQKLTYCFAETEGNNLRDVLSIPGINKNYTISNDLKEVREVLGIHAARNFIVQEIITVIETLGTRIHQSHIMLIADCMTRNHGLLPVNHQGTIKNLGPFTNMAFERAAETVIAASRGEIETISSVSSQIGTGRIIISGTGSVDVFTDPEYVEPTEDSIKITTIPLTIPKLSSAIPSNTNTPSSIIRTNPIVSSVNSAVTLNSGLANILRRRKQDIGTVVNIEPPVCSNNDIPIIEYVYNNSDIPIPLINNHRPDLFDIIASSIGLFDSVETTVTRIQARVGRLTLPAIRTVGASSLLK